MKPAFFRIGDRHEGGDGFRHYVPSPLFGLPGVHAGECLLLRWEPAAAASFDKWGTRDDYWIGWSGVGVYRPNAFEIWARYEGSGRHDVPVFYLVHKDLTPPEKRFHLPRILGVHPNMMVRWPEAADR